VYEIIPSISSLKPHYGCVVTVKDRTFKTSNLHTTHKEAHQEVAEKAYKALVEGITGLDELPENENQEALRELDKLTQSMQNTSLHNNTSPTKHEDSEDDLDLVINKALPPKKLGTPMFLQKPNQTAVEKIQNTNSSFFKNVN